MDKLTPQLNEEQLKANIDSLVTQKAPSEYIQSYIDNYQSDGNGSYSLKQTTPEPSIAQDIGAAAKETFVKPFQDRMQQIVDRPDQSFGSDVLQTAGALAGGVSDIALGAVKEGVKVFTPQAVQDKVSELAQKAGITVAGAIPQEALTALANHPEALGNIQAIVDLATTVPAIKPVAEALQGVAKPAIKVVEQGAKTSLDLASKALTPSEKALESKILVKYQKGVKPTIQGQKTAQNVVDYKQNVISGVKTIKENMADLQFTNDAGEIIKGETPKNLQQFSDAIDQTKKSVFKQYDTLAKKAGGAGVTVDTSKIASELDSVINDKALSITSPNAIAYAKATKDRLLNTGIIDAETAQNVVQNYNKSLEAFYRNPSYDNATQAAIDATIANNVRKTLDEGISSLTGKQYGALKKQYGALKAIEKDVVKASLRDARKNVKGLIDFTDIFTGSQLVHGLATMNPATIASGIASKGIQTIHKTLNDPNRAIEKMFATVGKLK